MDHLTDDCLLHLFSKLPLEDVWSISKTCTRFLNLCHFLRWKTIKLDNNKKNRIGSKKFDHIMKLCGNSVRTIEFLSADRQTDLEIAKTINTRCHNLICLELHKVSLESVVHLCRETFPRLSRLHLDIDRPEKGLDTILQSTKFRKLKDLCLKNSYLHMDLTKFDIIGLHRLILKYSRVRNMLDFFCRNKNTLRHLYLIHMSYPEEDLHNICETLPQLNVLSIKTESATIEVGDLRNITSLRLCGGALQIDTLLQNMATFNRLEHLRLDYVRICPETFRHLAMMTSLKSLCLAKLKYLDSDYLKMLNGNSFEQVVFLDCFTNAKSLKEFVKMSPRLTHFKAETFLQITDSDYNEMINSRPGLNFEIPTFWKRKIICS